MRQIIFFLSFLCTTLLFSADNWNAETYHKHSSSQKEAATDLLSHITIKGNEQVLDVGCGDGKITARLSGELLNAQFLGVDISQSMITFAQKNFPIEKYSNLVFQIMDAQFLAFDKKFDWVLSFTALQWVGNHNAFLRGTYQVLNDGGKLAVSFPMGLPKMLQEAVDEVSMKEKWKGYFKDFTSGWNFSSKQRFSSLLTQHHFTSEYLKVVDQRDVFPSKEIFQQFISEWFPYLRPIPHDLKQQFMSEVIHRFIELEPLDVNQCLHFNVKRLEIVAVKNDGF